MNSDNGVGEGSVRAPQQPRLGLAPQPQITNPADAVTVLFRELVRAHRTIRQLQADNARLRNGEAAAGSSSSSASTAAAAEEFPPSGAPSSADRSRSRSPTPPPVTAEEHAIKVATLLAALDAANSELAGRGKEIERLRRALDAKQAEVDSARRAVLGAPPAPPSSAPGSPELTRFSLALADGSLTPRNGTGSNATPRPSSGDEARLGAAATPHSVLTFMRGANTASLATVSAAAAPALEPLASLAPTPRDTPRTAQSKATIKFRISNTGNATPRP